MIVVRISGGLGNQIFQYVLVRYLELLGKEVCIDLSAYKYVKEHCGPEFFNVFSITRYTAVNRKLKYYYVREHIVEFLYTLLKKCKFLPEITRWKIRHIIPFICKSYNMRVLRLDYMINSPEELKCIDNCIINGVFGNPETLLNLKKELKDELQFNIGELSLENKNILDLITKSNSVSIHVRRGDFDSGKTRTDSITLNLEYYLKAICLIKSQLDNPAFFVFADDKEWVKEQFFIEAFYVDCNTGLNSYLDMYLMSNCKHNIIANSTFSWWGAWLNCNKNKTVIMPKYWYGSDLAVICNGWIVLENEKCI